MVHSSRQEVLVVIFFNLTINKTDNVISANMKTTVLNITKIPHFRVPFWLSHIQRFMPRLHVLV